MTSKTKAPLRTNREILGWIYSNLGEVIKKAISASKTDIPEEIIAAICCRETGVIIAKNAHLNSMAEISGITRGDYSQHPKDKEKIYHGYSFWQIDIDSFPDFIKSGNWKDPYKSCLMAISVLEGKRKYIRSKFPKLASNDLTRAMIAAYNFGEGNAVKRLTAGTDIDLGTAHNNYSASVIAFAAEYKSAFMGK